MIEEAAEFAREAHRGMFRKGTEIPYIVHPIETAVIVASFTDDEEVIAAALLHDVVEDTDVTGEELEHRFGPRVAGLVMAESEDKSRSWQERKAATLRHLESACRMSRFWPWEISSAISAVRPATIWFMETGYSYGLMRRRRKNMPGITGELQRHWRS